MMKRITMMIMEMKMLDRMEMKTMMMNILKMKLTFSMKILTSSMTR